MNLVKWNLILSTQELLNTVKMLKPNIQRYKRRKPQEEFGKRQQFESLEGNISPAALRPINQPS